MLNAAKLGELAAELYKQARKTKICRSGRNVKGDAMKQHLHAAGEPKMNSKGVFAFPRGHSVK